MGKCSRYFHWAEEDCVSMKQDLFKMSNKWLFVVLALQIAEADAVHKDNHAAVEGRRAHRLELHSYSSHLLPLDLSKILMNFWTIKILFLGKKHLLRFSGATSSLVSTSFPISNLVLGIQKDASRFWPSSLAMIHQQEQRTEHSDMPHVGLQQKGMSRHGKEHLRADMFALELNFLLYISDLKWEPLEKDRSTHHEISRIQIIIILVIGFLSTMK